MGTSQELNELLAVSIIVSPGVEREAEGEIWARILFNWLSERRPTVKGLKGTFLAEAVNWAEYSTSSC